MKYQQGAPPEGRSIVGTVIEPGKVYATVLQNGKQVAIIHAVISKDGKTDRWTIKGMDDKGKQFEALELWEKQ